MNRLVLGTAQLGLRYGIANLSGKPAFETAESIVAKSWQTGVRYYDTAKAYGDSETILGKALRNVGVADEARVISKFSPTLETGDAEAILRSLRESLARIGTQRLWGILLHREEQLDQWNNGLKTALDRARKEGLIAHVGVSVYTPQRALQALEIPGIDVLQVPASLFDRRMRRQQVFARASGKGVTVFIRSIYLQGLALFGSEQAKATVPFAQPAVTALERFCKANGVDQKRFAFEYARDFSSSALRIIGAETPEQVIENSQLENKNSIDAALFGRWDEAWPNDDEELVNPSRWPVTSQSKK